MNVKIFIGGIWVIIFGAIILFIAIRTRKEDTIFKELNVYKAVLVFILGIIGGFALIVQSLPNCHILHNFFHYLLN